MFHFNCLCFLTPEWVLGGVSEEEHGCEQEH